MDGIGRLVSENERRLVVLVSHVAEMRDFMRRAYRRAVADEDVKPVLKKAALWTYWKGAYRDPGDPPRPGRARPRLRVPRLRPPT